MKFYAIVTVLAFAVTCTTEAWAISRKKECKLACGEAIAACSSTCGEFGKLGKICKKAVLKSCRKEGVAFCQSYRAPAVSTTTSLGSSTSTTTSTNAVTTTTEPASKVILDILSVSTTIWEGEWYYSFEIRLGATLNSPITLAPEFFQVISSLGERYDALPNPTGSPDFIPMNCSTDNLVPPEGTDTCFLRFRMPSSVYKGTLHFDDGQYKAWHGFQL